MKWKGAAQEAGEFVALKKKFKKHGATHSSSGCDGVLGS